MTLPGTTFFSATFFALATALLPAAAPVNSATEWTELFNGSDLAGWSPLIEKSPPGTDPGGYVVVRDQEIHMYADTALGEKVPFGLIVSDRAFSRFHLELEYAWGPKKFAPRLTQLRDAGLLYHIQDATKLSGPWPWSMECQIQEGDTGDIVPLKTRAFTWLNPEPAAAPPGQGTPGMLPEYGGNPSFRSGGYIGRFPEADKLEGWNKVEAFVQADEQAVFLVNGITRSRVFEIQTGGGAPLAGGRIGLQLEGSEIRYRHVRIRELPEPLRVASRYASLSSVRGISHAQMMIEVSNPGPAPVPCTAMIDGRDAAAFTVAGGEKAELAPGETQTLRLGFSPTGPAGRYSAGLQIGTLETGTFVILQGLATDALEGENEPPLQSIVHALGIGLDTGGGQLKLDTHVPKIGASVPADAFRKKDGGLVRITPVARFSPPGAYPFGWYPSDGGEETTVGTLSDSAALPDAHQRLFPPLASGAPSASFDPGEASFGLFIKAGHQTIAMDVTRHAAKVSVPVRIFPIATYQGRGLKDAFLVGFEEASNGDYQDTVFILENVAIVATPVPPATPFATPATP